MYFIFKGIKSTEMGVTVLTQPPIKSPESRTWDSFIDNKDGADSLFLGYKPIELTMEIAVEGKENLDKVLGWLDGEGQLIRSDFPDRYRNVHIVEGIELNMIHPELWQGSFTYLVVDPYWYKVGDEWSGVGEGVGIYTAEDFGPILTDEDKLNHERAPLDYLRNNYVRNVLPEKFSELKGKVVDSGNFTARAYNVDKYKGRKVAMISYYGDTNSYDEVSIGLRNTTKSEWVYGYKTYKIEEGKVISDQLLIPEDEDSYSLYEYFGRAGNTGGNTYHITDRGILLDGISDRIHTPWEFVDEKYKVVDDWGGKMMFTKNYGNYSVMVAKGFDGVIHTTLRGRGVPKADYPREVCVYIENFGSTVVMQDRWSGTSKSREIPNGFKGVVTYTMHKNGYSTYISTVSAGGEINVKISPIMVRRESNESVPLKEVKETIAYESVIDMGQGTGHRTVNFNREAVGDLDFSAEYSLESPNSGKVLWLFRNGGNDRRYMYIDVNGTSFSVKDTANTPIEYSSDSVLVYKDHSNAASSKIGGILFDVEVSQTSLTLDNPSSVTNEGNTKSYPIIHLKNNSKDTNVVRLNINDSIIRYEFPQGETEVFINLMGMRAGTESSHTGYYRHDVRDKYLYVERDKGMHLNPGPNTITSDGDVEIKLLRKDRWI